MMKNSGKLKMKLDELITYLHNIDIGNRSDTYSLSEKDYKDLEKENGEKFNYVWTAFGIVSIKIKNEAS